MEARNEDALRKERRAEVTKFTAELRRIAGITSPSMENARGLSPAERNTIKPLLDDMQEGHTASKKLRSIQGFLAANNRISLSTAQAQTILSDIYSEYRQVDALVLLENNLNPAAAGWAQARIKETLPDRSLVTA